jgi:hypothetical protein
MLKVSSFTLLFAMFLFATLSSAATCPWLPLSVVREALPQYEPWTVDDNSGIGLCTFVGESSKVAGTTTGMPRLTIVQQTQASPVAAATFTKEFRAAAEAVYRVKKNPSLGAEGFASLPKDPNDSALANWTGHAGSSVLMATLMRETDPNDKALSAVDGIMVKALQAVSQPGVADKALACPYFDEAIIAKLLPGAGRKIQQFGTDSCLASSSDSSTVLLMRIASSSPAKGTELLQNMKSSDCTPAAMPALGASAAMEFACKSGNARATILFLKGGTLFSVSHIPINREPTKAERDLLQVLGEAMIRNAAAK